MLSLAFMTSSVAAQEASDVTITVQGEITSYQGIMVEENTLVPLLSLVQSMDLKITWYPGVEKVTLSSGENTLTYVMDSTTITVNGEAVTSPAAPQLIDNQEYLPLRIIAENFGFTVNWNSATATVYLSK
jgi:hypothetical protein